MNRKLTILLIGIVMSGCSEAPKTDKPKEEQAQMTAVSEFTSVIGKGAAVFTTAHETDLRLARTGEVTFEGMTGRDRAGNPAMV